MYISEILIAYSRPVMKIHTGPSLQFFVKKLVRLELQKAFPEYPKLGEMLADIFLSTYVFIYLFSKYLFV